MPDTAQLPRYLRRLHVAILVMVGLLWLRVEHKSGDSTGMCHNYRVKFEALKNCCFAASA